MKKIIVLSIVVGLLSGCAALPPIGWAVVGAVSAGFGAGYFVKDQVDRPAPTP